MTETCPHCKQTLPPPLGFNIYGQDGVVLRLVHEAGEHGISLDDLVARGYKNSKAKNVKNVLKQNVWKLNQKLMPLGWRVFSMVGGGGRYVLRSKEDATEWLKGVHRKRAKGRFTRSAAEDAEAPPLQKRGQEHSLGDPGQEGECGSGNVSSVSKG